MTEPTTDAADQVAGGDSADAGQSANYTPPATQADLDRIIADRVTRTKNQFKDYGDLKAKAAELDQIRQANQSELERATNELTRWQTEAETWRTAAVGSRIEAIASNDFADPTDAITALGDKGKYLDAGGQIDEAAIRADLADVLEKKPHWRRQDGAPAPRVPAPNPAQGTGGRPAVSPAQEFASILQGQLRS